MRARAWICYSAAFACFLAAWLRPLGHENPLLLYLGAMAPLLFARPSFRMAMACLLIPCAWLLCGRFFPVGGGLWTLPLVTFALVLAHDTESWLAIAGAAALMLLWADLPGPAAYRPDPARMVFGIGSGLALAAFVVARLFRRPASLPAAATAPPGR